MTTFTSRSKNSSRRPLSSKDFIVGFKVVPSKNHPEPDICDDLAGAYPKTFDFSGWHPHCRCHAEPIMKTDEEMMKDNAAILAGAEPSAGSVNAVRNVPPGFSEWVKANETKIGAARSLPYFIRDNKAVVDNILRPKPVRSALDIANGNVADGIPGQDAALQKAQSDHKAVLHYGNNMLRIMGGVSDETRALAEAIEKNDVDAILQETRKLKEIGKQIMSVGYFSNPLALVREYSLKEIIPAAKHLSIWSKRDDWRKLTLSEKKKKLATDIKFFNRNPNLQSGFEADLLWHELNRLTYKVKPSPATILSESQKNAALRHSKRTQLYYEDIHYRWALREMRVKGWSDFKASTETATEEMARYRGNAEEFKEMLRNALHTYNRDVPAIMQLSSEIINEIVSAQVKLFDSKNTIKRPGTRTWIQDNIAYYAPKHDLRKLRFPLYKSSSFAEIVQKRASLVRNDINRLSRIETELESIEKLAGGDLTKGSCFSLAQAFAARRLGYDVTDFRGGISCDVHGFDDRTGYLADFGRFRAKSSEEVFNYITNNTSIGEYYLLSTHEHAAIIKRTKNNKLFYLELQSSDKGWYKNGWHRLSGTGLLKARFGTFSKEISEQLIGFTDIAKHFDSLAHNLETIHNTGAQIKGIKGGCK